MITTASPDNVAVNVDENGIPSPPNLKKNHSSQRTYDPNRMPPDLVLAEKHGKAKKVYVSKKDDNIEEIGRELCLCCGLPIESKKIPMNSGLDKLYHLGSGFPLYFKFIKYAIGMLLLIFIVGGAFNLVTNVVQGDCESADTITSNTPYCVKGYILSFTIPNKRDHDDYLRVQLALNLATVVVIMFFFHYLRYQFRKTEIEADDRTISPPDYTVMIEGIPPEATNEEVEAWIKELGAKEDMKLEVERIVRSYAIDAYLQLLKKNRQLVKQKNMLRNKQGQFEPQNEATIKDIDSQIQDVGSQLQDLKKVGIKRCSILFVTFKTAHQATYVHSLFKKETLISKALEIFLSKIMTTNEQYDGLVVRVVRAPEPTDVLWENLGSTPKERATIQIFTNILTIILVALSFGLILLINWGQEEALEKYGEGSSVVQGLSIVASIVISMTNAIMAIVINFLTRFERHVTFTGYLQGVAQKLATAQFFNTALTNLFSELILSTGTKDVSRLEAINFYGKGGLLENMYWVFIINAFLSPILALIDPMYFLKLYQQYQAKKKAENLRVTQKEAHTLFEGPIFDIPPRYSAMIKIVLVCTFYTPAIPFALIFTIPGLILWYWIDKYLLLNRVSLPIAIGDNVNAAMVEFLEWAACTFAVGNIFYFFTLRNSESNFAFSNEPLVWITLGISLFHIVFPMEFLNKKLFPIEDLVTENQTFEEARLEFHSDYDIQNPITRPYALKASIRRVQKKKGEKEANKEVKNLFEKGLFGKIDGSSFMKLLSHDQKDDDKHVKEEINFGFLDAYVEEMENEGAQALPKHQVTTNEQERADLGDFFNQLSKNETQTEGLKKLIPQINEPANEEVSPLKEEGIPMPRKESNHNEGEGENQGFGNIMGLFGLGKQQSNQKEETNAIELVQNPDPENLFTGETTPKEEYGRESVRIFNFKPNFHH